MRHLLLSTMVAAGLAPVAALAEEGERVTITGEFIDTWCYFSA